MPKVIPAILGICFWGKAWKMKKGQYTVGIAGSSNGMVFNQKKDTPTYLLRSMFANGVKRLVYER